MFSIDEKILNNLSIENSISVNLNKLKTTELKDLSFITDDLYTINSLGIEQYFNQFRIKSLESIKLKLEKYNNKDSSFTLRTALNDIIGIRIRTNYRKAYVIDYLKTLDYLKVVDLLSGKVNDDGYRAIHLYYQKTNKHYPIEIQIWFEEDYSFNIWLHKYCYKKENSTIQHILHEYYVRGFINSEEDFVKYLTKLKR